MDGQTISNALTDKGNQFDMPGKSAGSAVERPKEPQDASLIYPGTYYGGYFDEKRKQRAAYIIKKQANKNFPYVFLAPYFYNDLDTREITFKNPKASEEGFPCFQKGNRLICPEEDPYDPDARLEIIQNNPNEIQFADYGFITMNGGSGQGIYMDDTVARKAK